MSKPHRRSFSFLRRNHFVGSAKRRRKILPDGTGGKGPITANVVIEMEPGEPGTGFEFVTRSLAAIRAKEYIRRRKTP